MLSFSSLSLVSFLVCSLLECKIKMNLLLVVVEHPAGYIACLHSQDNCLHQVAGSLEDQVVFRQQSLRRQWFTCNKLSLSKNTLITVKQDDCLNQVACSLENQVVFRQ